MGLPNFMDVFTWSIPFVAEKVVEMLHHILKDCKEDDDSDSEKKIEDIKPPPIQPEDPTSLQKRSGVLKNKIKFVSKLLKMQKLLREKSEDIVLIKNDLKTNKLPYGMLLEGSTAIEAFKVAMQNDKHNEKRPDH